MSAYVEHRSGHDDRAVHRLEQLMDLAVHVDRGHPALVGHLVGIGISRVAVVTIADIVPTLQIAPAATTAATARHRRNRPLGPATARRRASASRR
jgi:hypothetical protein